MSWIHKLYETYEQCAGALQFSSKPPLPVSHTNQQAHIEITIDIKGNFLRAVALSREETLLPVTEDSASRTSNEAPHPLSDKIQYCAADYPLFGGKKKSYYHDRRPAGNHGYVGQLSDWCQSEFFHQKAKAVYEYVRKETVVADLVKEQVLFLGEDGKLLTKWESDAPVPPVFKNLTAKSSERDQGDAFVRWRIEIPGNPLTASWEDQSLKDAWIGFDASQNATRGLCMVTGEETLLGKKHPKRLRHPGDGAKLISSNDREGFTFRGRFIDADQACGVGFEVTQKAHNALRWLIERQAFRNNDQVIVAWAVSGENVPDPWKNSGELFGLDADQAEKSIQIQGDAEEAFARRLKRYIAGYRTKLGSTNDIVVMGLDSATPGRMALTYYRELTGSDFLIRVQAWHEAFAWHQNYPKKLKFVGAPSPREIAEAAYGSPKGETSKKLHKATVERLLPCIIDGQAIPRDLMESTTRRTCNRSGLEKWEFEKLLGIACALLRGYFKERGYKMALEADRTTRDYLYGRLLAIAESIESFALSKSGEKRDTTASRLMQRFSDRPYSTWKNIELALNPYKSRLRSSEKFAGFLFKREKLLDEVICAFAGNDFTNDMVLTGEFLLGYHCQRKALLE